MERTASVGSVIWTDTDIEIGRERAWGTKKKSNYVRPKLTKEEKAERSEQRAYRKREILEEKERKAYEKQIKIENKRELAILKFMLKHDVLNHHHKQKESQKKEILKQIDKLNVSERSREYHPYVWNHYGEGKSYMWLSLLGCLWNSSEFENIHDVPLDGTYMFYCYDSGQRGCGSFNYITAIKVEHEVKVPYVNPGGFPQITV